MRKSRFLALFLTIVFVLANVAIPSFAASTFKYGDPKQLLYTGSNQTWIVSPIEGHPLHFAYTLEDESATYVVENISNIGGYGADNVSISEDGLLTFSPVAFDAATKTLSIGGKATDSTGTAYSDSKSRFLGAQVGFNFTFDDDITPETTGILGANFNPTRSVIRSKTKNVLTIATDDSGRKYGYSSEGAFVIYPYYSILSRYMSTNQKNGAIPFVYEMELKDFTDGVAFPASRYMLDLTAGKITSTWKDAAITSGATASETFDFDGFNANDGDWHKYKWVITPETYTNKGGTTYPAHFDLYIDDQLVLKDVSVTDFDSTSSTQTVALSATGVDNVKAYGTSLGFAYDVSLASDGTTVGSTLTASAAMAHMPVSNIPETLNVGIYRADTENGTYTKVSDGTTYTTTEDDVGKFFKAGAFVKEADFDECESEVVYSYVVEFGADDSGAELPDEPEVLDPVYTWGTKPSANESLTIWAPYGNETYDIPFTYSVANATSDGQFTITDASGNVVEGVTVVHDATTSSANNKNAVLKIGDINTATHYWNADNTITGDASTNIALTISCGDMTDTIYVRKYQKNTFENGNTNGWSGVVKSDASYEGGNYLYNSSEKSIELRDFFGTNNNTYDFRGVLAIDFDAKIDKTFKVKPNPDQFGNIVIQQYGDMTGYVYSMYHGSNHPVYVGEGWQPVRIIFDFPNAKFSCFINNVPVVVNASLQRPNSTYGSSDTTKGMRYLLYTGSMDNLGFSNVTVSAPVVYNAAIMNAAVGSDIVLDYDFYCGATAYKGDADDLTTVEYKIADSPNGSWTTLENAPTSDDLGKYVKAVITPKVSYNGAEIAGAVVETNPVLIGDVAVNSVSINRIYSSDGVTTGYTYDFASVNGGFDQRVITENTSGYYNVTFTINASTTAASGKQVKFVLAHYSSTGSNLYLNGLATSGDVNLTNAPQNVTFNFTTSSKVGQSELFKLFMLTSDGLVPVNSVINLR